MNFAYFIAKRIISRKTYKSSVSAPIIKIGIAAIAIGIIVMLIAIATSIGLQQKIRDKIAAFNGHITISNFDSNQSQESIVPISTKQDFYPQFTAVENVNHIQAVATKFGVIRTETDFEGIVLKGVGADYDWQYFKDFLVAGRVPDYTKKRNEDILISQSIANNLGLKVGDKCHVYFLKEAINQPPSIITYTIVGIFNSGFHDFDKTFVIGDIRHIQRLNRWESDQIGAFEIFIDDFNSLDQTTMAVYKNTPSTLNTQSITNKFINIFEWISIFDTNTYGIIGIMIIVAGINMITALLVLILERTQMIGILKALGSSTGTIRKIFLLNASYLIIVGLFWGNLIGLGLLFAQKYFHLFPLNPDVYYVTQAPVYINAGYILALNVGTFLVCLIMLLIPSHIISKIAPVTAIQFK